jgi:SAM-dependent methyltransferase
MACPACSEPRSTLSYLGEGWLLRWRYEYRQCDACGSLYVAPMPDEATLDAMYGPEYLAHYDEGAGALHGGAVSGELAAELSEAAGLAARLRPGGRLLDVGCGAGAFLREAARHGLSARGHERVASTAEKVAASTGLPVSSGPMEALIAAGERFDVVHMADVVEHHPRPIELLGEAIRLLAPGGVLLLRGPLENQTCLFQQVVKVQRLARRLVRRERPLGNPPWHVILFSLPGWRALCRRAGLTCLNEQVGEVHWPVAPDGPLGPARVIKEASIQLSHSSLGRRLGLGNRVISVWGLHA